MHARSEYYSCGDSFLLIGPQFTPPGPENSVTVRTKLLYAPPVATVLSGSTVVSSDNTYIPSTQPQSDCMSTRQLSSRNLDQVEDSEAKNLPFQHLVVRIEVQDTGVGIRPRDMIDNRLFSPYVQTEIGRHQGELEATKLYRLPNWNHRV